ncbi:MAG: Maf family protein [Planctomycetia bacterium]|nr:Maf family protein [Planctomycetia bacterium]
MVILESRRSIVLASRSPRRLQLAEAEGWLVRVVAPPEAAETDAAPRGCDESLKEYVQRLAGAKAEAVAALGTTGTILSCDTLGEVDGRTLGKPTDQKEARSMLLSLSGKRHRVLTGVCLWQCPELDPLFSCMESELSMDRLSEDFIDWYLASDLWQGKAGACGFQDERLPLKLVAGSPSNVVGLPLEAIRTLLATVTGQLRARSAR